MFGNSFNATAKSDAHQPLFNTIESGLKHGGCSVNQISLVQGSDRITVNYILFAPNIMSSSVPGSFPAIYNAVDEQGSPDPGLPQLIKLRNNLKLEYKDTLNNLILLELIAIYLADRSFFRLVVRISLQLFLSSINIHTLRQWIEYNLLSMNQPVSEETIRTQYKYFKTTILVEIFVINGLAFLDHLFIFRNYAQLPHISFESMTSYLNSHTKNAIEYYQSKQTFQYYSVLINLIGEAQPTGRLGLLILDCAVLLGQYIMYSLIFWQKKIEPPKPPDETSELMQDKEDGYQGTITIFNVEMFPNVGFTKLWNSFTM
ncbi:hypothetical protein OGAPHI_005536 [Ogataea philodendri]|uniref:DUF1746 domain-containing protein n=1 Tax=Ogataea philodendri TaxID=1378263 RepID=A0A9P8T223_9ASCO|nr:uncharacterized protein OGAPHI_005536 [Ogataea philodendri]KAH3662286.1 hypothetical protein OGAPHI_005536 [Ogataea philodendri]